MTEAPRRGREDGVEVAPTRLATPGRSPDPLPIVVGAVVVALVLAVVKPWDVLPADTSRPAPSLADASTAPTPAESARPAAQAAALATDDAWLLGAVSPRDAWGVLAIADPASGAASTGAPGTAIEHWSGRVPGPPADSPSAASAAAGTPRAPALIRSGTPVRLLGVSAPLARTPLGIRVWRARGDQWRRVAATPPLAEHPAAHRLLRPSGTSGSALPAWPAGRYRLDVLLGSEVLSIDIRLDAPDDGDGLSFAGPRPAPGLFAAPVEDGVGRGVGRGIGAVADGPLPFVVAGGRAVPVDARAGDPLDAAAVWLDADRLVGSTGSRGVRTIGVALPRAATGVVATVRRIAPGPIGPEVAVDVVTIADEDGAPRPVAEARPPRGLTWPAGTYAIDVAWATNGVDRTATWHLDLVPGYEPVPSVPLAAGRTMAAQAARPGLLVPRPARLGMEAGSDALAWFRLGSAIDCATGRIDEPPAAIGVVLDPDQVVLEATGSRTRSGGGTAPVGLRIAPVRPGLTLLIPRDTARFRAGIHELTLAIGPTPEAAGSAAPGTTSIQTSICLGVPPFDR